MDRLGPALSASALVLVALIEARSICALVDGMQALLRDRIIQAHNHYADKGHIPVYGMENVLAMYKAYHELGGSGTVTKLVDDLQVLPTDKKA